MGDIIVEAGRQRQLHVELSEVCRIASSVSMAATAKDGTPRIHLQIDIHKCTEVKFLEPGHLFSMDDVHTLEVIDTFEDQDLNEIFAGISQNTVLERLEISGTRLIEAGAHAIANALGRCLSLRNLSLSENECSCEAYTLIGRSLSINTVLEQLSLTKSSLREDVAGWIAAMLDLNTNLHTLSLEQSYCTSAGFVAIAEAVKNNTTLLTLNLSATLSDDNLSHEYAKILMHNRTLQHLDLSVTRMRSDGASLVAAALAQNTSLLSLTIKCNYVEREGVTCISKALSRNTSLEMLDLSSNYMGEAGAMALAEALSTNRTLKKLCINSCTHGQHGTYAVCKALMNHARFHPLDLQCAPFFLKSLAPRLGVPCEHWSNERILAHVREGHADKVRAFVMGLHVRLGAGSYVLWLGEDATRMVLEAYYGLPRAYLARYAARTTHTQA